MSDVADRFRPRLGEDWPGPLAAMFDAVVSEDAHQPEHVVGGILEKWLDDESITQPLRDALRNDALAFVLSDHHGGEWGDTHFGPWGSGRTEKGETITAPRRERVTKDAIEQWRERAAQVDQHVARARYSDAAWDLAPIVGIERSHTDAVNAIDSYIGQCVNSRSGLQVERCLRRAHSLARSIGDVNRKSNVRTSLLELCKLSDSEACDRLRFLACDLYVLDRKSGASDEEKTQILGWIEEGLQRCVDQVDPFDGERFAKRLDQFYKSRSDSDQQRRVARQFGGLLEAWAGKGNGMLAMHNYKKAHAVYQAAGLTDEANRVRSLVQTATAQSQDEMSKLSSTVEIPVDKMDAFVNSIVSREWHEALRCFIGNFIHRRQEFEKQLDMWLESSQMYGLVNQTVITESGNSVDLKSPQEDRESHIVLKGTEVMRFAEPFMQRVLDELFVQHEVTPEKLVNVINASPLFSDDRHILVERAVKCYCKRDYAGFLHMAIPQIEHAIRLLYQHAAQKATTTTRDSRRWRTLTLNQILDSEALEALLGQDMVDYMRVALTHDLGMNLRNLLCHGLVNQTWFNRGRADRTLHILLMLALLIRGDAVDDRDSDKSSSDDISKQKDEET